EAAETGRLVLLDLSTAWDHHGQVMSEITYADPGVVSLVSSAFVPVRVDGDERPDVFVRYGMGAWPTTAILLPDGHPMYYPDKDGKVTRAGGTFYPPDAFRSYFSQLAAYYAENHEMVARVTKNIDDAILSKRNVDQAEVAPEATEAILSKVLDAYRS